MMKPVYTLLFFLAFSLSLTAQPITETWPMIHGNPSHTSSAHIDITFPLVLAHEFPLVANTEAGTAVSEDKIFFSCYGDPNTIYSVDLITGDSLWSFEVPNSGGGNQFCPAVGHGVVVMGGQSGPGLYGLDANTGAVLWLDTIGTMYDRAPAVYDSLVYVPSNEGLRCLDIATGNLLWRSEYGTPQISPAVDSLHVYFNSYGTNGAVIYAMDRLSGDIVWSTEGVRSGHSTSFILDDDLLYCGYRDTLTTFDKMTGDIVWQTALDEGEEIYYKGMAALTDSFLITKTEIDTSSLNHYRVIERATGMTRNRFFTTSWEWSAPVLFNNYLVECGYNEIRFLDMMTGDSVYGLTNLTFGQSPSQPIAAGDKIVLIGDGNHINILQSSPSGVRHLATGVMLDVFPNPTKERVNIQLSLEGATPLDLSVYTLSGTLIGRKGYGYLDAGKHILTYSVDQLSSGAYILLVQTDRGVLSKKVVVE